MHGDVAGGLGLAREPDPGEVASARAGETLLERFPFFVFDRRQVLGAALHLDVTRGALGLAVADRRPAVPVSPRGFDDGLPREQLEVDADRFDVDDRTARLLHVDVSVRGSDRAPCACC